METVESKPKVGVCLLSCYGVFGAFLKDEDVVEAQALEYLDLVAESMGLDKMLIAVVSNESLSMKYASEARENVPLNNGSWRGERLWHETNMCIEEENPNTKVFDRLEYLGSIHSNGIITPNISQFATKDGNPVEATLETFRQFKKHPESFELKPTDGKSYYYYNKYPSLVTVHREIPNVTSDEALCKAATFETITFLNSLKDKYDLRQIIAFTDNATRQEIHHVLYDGYDGTNMLDKDQIEKETEVPVVWVLNNPEDYKGVCKPNAYFDIKKVGDGYSGECHSGEFCLRGFEAGARGILNNIGRSEKFNPEKLELLSRVSWGQ